MKLGHIMKIQYEDIKTFLSKEKLLLLTKGVTTLAAIITIFFGISKFNITEAINIPALKTVAIMDSERKSSGIRLENAGLAPIRIKSINIYDKSGIPVKNNSYSLNEHFSFLNNRFHIRPIHSKDAIKEGATHWLLQSYVNTSVESVIVRDFLESASIEICYCSLTNRCESKTIGLKQHPYQQC